MRSSTIVMIGFAVVFGLLAVFIAEVWLNNQASIQKRNMEAGKTPVATQTVVVAKTPLRFGAELNAGMLQEVAWPADARPVGAFSKIEDLLTGGRRFPGFRPGTGGPPDFRLSEDTSCRTRRESPCFLLPGMRRRRAVRTGNC